MDMTDIKFSAAEKDLIVHKIKRHFSEELHQPIGSFDAEFLLDFFAKEVDAYFLWVLVMTEHRSGQA